MIPDSEPPLTCFVTDGVIPQATWQVEVKCRRAFNELTAQELYTTLTRQWTYWPRAYAVIVLLEPTVAGGRFHQDFIRLVRPGRAEDLLPSPLEALWERAAETTSFARRFLRILRSE